MLKYGLHAWIFTHCKAGRTISTLISRRGVASSLECVSEPFQPLPLHDNLLPSSSRPEMGEALIGPETPRTHPGHVSTPPHHARLAPDWGKLSAGPRGRRARPDQAPLGFRPGDDFRLASWAEGRPLRRGRRRGLRPRPGRSELGELTGGRPFLAAMVSSEETIAQLRPLQGGPQHRLADPAYRPLSGPMRTWPT